MYYEHVNDHQLQILENFSEKGYIIALDDFDDIGQALKKAETFNPQTFRSNKKYFLRQLEKEINILG